MTVPVPPGRGQWRLTLHQRRYTASRLGDTVIAELVDARSRQLVQQLNSAAVLTFSVDGQSPTAGLIQELAHDVVAWRWDENNGVDVPVFRGVIAQSEDTISEQADTVNYTCHDYIDLLTRRWVTAATGGGITYGQTDQDLIVSGLLNQAIGVTTSSGAGGVGPGVPLTPGAYLPFAISLATPAGATRGLSQVYRDRNYPGQSNIGQAIDDLAHVIGGFDYDVRPDPAGVTADHFRIFYPQQGVTRTTPQLVYGSTVASLTRSVNSADYGNYWRVLGNNGSDDPLAAQFYAEAWNADAANGVAGAVGMWMNAENASDVTVQATLNEQAAGDLNLYGVLIPSYSLALRPGAYTWTNPNMGDTVPLVIQKGRLNVNTTIRVVGIEYDIGDDGQEDVTLTVGRAPTTLADLLAAPVRDVNALARR